MRTGARASLTLSRSPCKHSGWTPETQMHHRKWKYRVLRILELTLYFSFFISLCFGLPEAYGVPRPGIRSKPQCGNDQSFNHSSDGTCTLSQQRCCQSHCATVGGTLEPSFFIAGERHQDRGGLGLAGGFTRQANLTTGMAPGLTPGPLWAVGLAPSG